MIDELTDVPIIEIKDNDRIVTSSWLYVMLLHSFIHISYDEMAFFCVYIISKPLIPYEPECDNLIAASADYIL